MMGHDSEAGKRTAEAIHDWKDEHGRPHWIRGRSRSARGRAERKQSRGQAVKRWKDNAVLATALAFPIVAFGGGCLGMVIFGGQGRWDFAFISAIIGIWLCCFWAGVAAGLALSAPCRAGRLRAVLI